MALPEGITPITQQSSGLPAGITPVSQSSGLPEGITPVKTSVAKDIATQVPVGIAAGFAELGQSFIDFVTPYISEMLLGSQLEQESSPETFYKKQEEAVKEISSGLKAPLQEFEKNLPGAQTLAGGLTRGISQFAVGGAAAKAMGTSAVASKILRGVLSGSIAGFTAFDPYEKRLSDLMVQSDSPVFNNTLTKWLASNKDDPALEARLKQSLEFAGFGLAADAAFSGLKMLKGVYAAKRALPKAIKLMDKLQPKITDWVNQGLSHNEAFNRTLREAGISSDEAFNAAIKSGRGLNFKPVIPTTDVIKQTADKAILSTIKDNVFDAGKTIFDKVDYALGNLSTRVFNISTEVGYKLRRFEYNTSVQTHEALAYVKPFLKGMRRLNSTLRSSKADRDLYNEIAYNLRNGTYDRVEQLIQSVESKSTREMLGEGFTNVKDFLKKVHAIRSEVDPKMGFVEDYFPSAIKNYKKFARDRGFLISDIDKEINKLAAAKGRSLTASELGDAVNKYMRGLNVPRTGLMRPDYTKARTLESVSRADMKYYQSPETALTDYIHTIVHDINKRNFFGYNADNLDESIGYLLGNMRASGKLTGEDVDSLTKLIQARFGGGEQAMSKSWQNLKNGYYAVTLKDPTNALNQIGDWFATMYQSGVYRTIKNLVRISAEKVTGKPGLRMQDLGLDRIAEEFASTSKMAKYVNAEFKLNFMKQVDTIGKTLNIRTTLDKYGSMVRTEKGLQKFISKYGAAFSEQDLNKVIDDLAKGNITNDTKFIAFNELSNMQPIALSEMPEYYLRHPNMRILYTLRSFTLKQFDILRRDAYNEIRNGNVAKGVQNLTRYVMIMSIAGMTTDQLKSWLLNRGNLDIEPTVINNLLKLIGLSSYIVNHAVTDKASTTISSVLLPPIGAAADPIVSDLQHWGDTMNSLKVLPYGTMLYNYFGGGLEKYKKYQAKQHKQRRTVPGRARGRD